MNPTPEVVSITLGLAFSLGIFATKTAVGQYYFLARQPGKRRRTVFLLLCSALYAALFVLAFALISKFDVLAAAGAKSGLFQAGAAIHLAVSAGLLVWGVLMLIHAPDFQAAAPGRPGKGWLLLALPCPVCATAIFLVSAFLLALFPRSAVLVCAGSAGFFLLVTYLVIGGLFLASARWKASPERLTGQLMIGIALYFFAVILIMPQFQAIEKIYRIAAAPGNAGSLFRPAWLLILAPLAAGLIYQYWKHPHTDRS